MTKQFNGGKETNITLVTLEARTVVSKHSPGSISSAGHVQKHVFQTRSFHAWEARENTDNGVTSGATALCGSRDFRYNWVSVKGYVEVGLTSRKWCLYKARVICRHLDIYRRRDHVVMRQRWGDVARAEDT